MMAVWQGVSAGAQGQERGDAQLLLLLLLMMMIISHPHPRKLTRCTAKLCLCKNVVCRTLDCPAVAAAAAADSAEPEIAACNHKRLLHLLACLGCSVLLSCPTSPFCCCCCCCCCRCC
jgi:hypothetical protein